MTKREIELAQQNVWPWNRVLELEDSLNRLGLKCDQLRIENERLRAALEEIQWLAKANVRPEIVRIAEKALGSRTQPESPLPDSGR